MNEQGKPQILFNTSIWAADEVSGPAGYTVDELRPCLYDLAYFIRDSLKPDRLTGFDLESIRPIQYFTP